MANQGSDGPSSGRRETNEEGLPIAILGNLTGYTQGLLNSRDFTVFIATINPLTEKYVGSELYHREVLFTYTPEATQAVPNPARVQVYVSKVNFALMTLVLSISRTMLLNKRSEDNIKLLLVGELLSPVMSHDRKSNRPQELIITLVNNLLTNGMNLFENDTIMVGGKTITIPSTTQTQDYLVALPILYGMSLNLKKVYQYYIRDTHIEYYVAMATRGNVSDEKVAKIQSALNNTAGYTPSMSASRIRSYYNHHGSALTPENAKKYLTFWESLIAETALQLKLVLGQAIYGGLTQFVTIGVAMLDFADFPWSKLDKAFPGEFGAFNNAVRIVQGNPYYGYTRDLGDVAARNYKNLAWASKELLIRSGGHDSLKGYQGWAKSCLHKLAVNQLIDDYLGKRANDLASEENQRMSNDQLTTVHLLKQHYGIFKGESNSRKRPRSDDDGAGPSGVKRSAVDLAREFAAAAVIAQTSGSGQTSGQMDVVQPEDVPLPDDDDHVTTPRSHRTEEDPDYYSQEEEDGGDET